MVFGPTVAFCFPMKVSVFDVHPYGEPNIRIGRELLACGLLRAWTAEMKDGGVAAFEHVRIHLNLHGSSIACIRNELPYCRRAGGKGREIDRIERRNETTGVHPNANSLGEHMAIDWQSRIDRKSTRLNSSHT